MVAKKTRLKGWRTDYVILPVKVRVEYKPRTKDNIKGTWQNAIHSTKNAIKYSTCSTHFQYTGSYRTRVISVGKAKKV